LSAQARTHGEGEGGGQSRREGFGTPPQLVPKEGKIRRPGSGRADGVVVGPRNVRDAGVEVTGNSTASVGGGRKRYLTLRKVEEDNNWGRDSSKASLELGPQGAPWRGRPKIYIKLEEGGAETGVLLGLGHRESQGGVKLKMAGDGRGWRWGSGKREGLPKRATAQR